MVAGMLYPILHAVRLIARQAKSVFLTSSLLLLADTANPEPGQPPYPLHLSYQTSDGRLVPIEGIELQNETVRLYYLDSHQNKILVNDLSRVSLELTEQELPDYVYQPERFCTTFRSSSSNASNPSKAFRYIYLGQDEAAEVWPQSQNQILAHLFVTVNDSGVRSLALADARQISEKGISIARRLRQEPGEEVSPTTPGVIAFSIEGPVRISQGARLKTQLSPLPDNWESPELQIDILLRATRNGRTDIIESELAKLPLKRRELSAFKSHLLYVAAFHGRTNEALKLLHIGADPLSETPSSLLRKYNFQEEYQGHPLRNALDAALRNSNTDTFKSIFESIPKRITAEIRERMLRSSIILGSYEIATFLSQHGTKLSRAFYDLDWVLDKTLKSGQHQLAEELASNFIQKFDAHSTYLNEYAPTITPSILNLFQEKGAAIDLPDENGNTPLLLAAGHGNIPAVCWLIDHGAALDSVNYVGHSALQYAIVNRQNESAACLIDQGADVNKLGPSGLTPLMFAALFDAPDLATKIIGSGGILNLDSEALDETLIAIASHDLSDILRQAIEQGLNRQRTVKGLWPLEWMLDYFQAEACLAVLNSTPTFQKTEIPSDQYSLSIQSLDTEWLKRSYKIELRPDRLEVRCIIDAAGYPHLVNILNDMPPVSRDQAKHLIETFRLTRDLIPSNSQLVFAEFVIRADSDEFEFPFDIRTQSLHAIRLPTP